MSCRNHNFSGYSNYTICFSEEQKMWDLNSIYLFFLICITARKPSIQATAKQIVRSFLQRNSKTASLTNNIYVRRNVPVGLFRDLLIIIDSSGSVGANNFKIAKQQVAKLLGLLCPRPDPFNVNSNNGYNRAALIQFSSHVIEEFDFVATKNLVELQSSINSVRYRGGSTCTGDAFEKAIQMFTSSKGYVSYMNKVGFEYLNTLHELT